MSAAKKDVSPKQQDVSNLTDEHIAENIERAQPLKQVICGLIMPISSNEGGSSEHWRQVRSIICDSLKETDLIVKMVSESDEVNVIHNNIVTNVYTNDIVICDVSSRNPNVMFELGMRLAFDRPVVIIKDRETPYTFDVGNIYHLEYPRSLNYSEILVFQKDLREKTLLTLEASQKTGYSPFLSNYKIQKVTSIETEFVGKEEFMISSMQEIMGELKKINRTSNVIVSMKDDLTNINANTKNKTNNVIKLSVVKVLTNELITSVFASNINYTDKEELRSYCIGELVRKNPLLPEPLVNEIVERVISSIHD